MIQYSAPELLLRGDLISLGVSDQHKSYSDF